MTSALPKKLKSDAILEALLEIRFEPPATAVAEIMVGRLADTPDWKGFNSVRLPMADIPAPMRLADPNLRYLPSIELVSGDGSVSVRVGPNVIAYSRRGNYPGWAVFDRELKVVVGRLYDVLPNVRVSRLGLRYINALRTDLHQVGSVDDMAISASVSGEKITDSLNLNFKTRVGTEFETMSRIATVDMAEGNIPEFATIIVDVDVYTGGDFSKADAAAVTNWVDGAHRFEKESFFKALGADATERLREE